MDNAHELRIRHLQEYWERKSRVFTTRNMIDGEDDREKFIKKILEISGTLFNDLDSKNYKLFIKTARWLNIILNDYDDKVQNKIENEIERIGILTLYVFLNPSESLSRFQAELGELIMNTTTIKLPHWKIEESITKNWNNVFNKLCILRERLILTSRYEISEDEDILEEFNMGRDTMWEPSHFLCTLLIRAWEDNQELINAVNKTELQKDAIMLLFEKKDKDVKNSQILLLYGDEAESAYVKGKWVFPAIQVPQFSSDNVWNNPKKFADMDKNVAEVLFQNNNKENLPNLKPILYLPSGQTGSFVIMLVEITGWSIDDVQKVFQSNKNKKISNGPFLYDRVELKTYDEVWKLAVNENKIYYRTLFVVACKLAITKSTKEEKLRILNTAKEIINKDLKENIFRILYINNRSQSIMVKELDEIFRDIVD